MAHLAATPRLENAQYSHGAFYGFSDGLALLLASPLAQEHGPLHLLRSLAPALPASGAFDVRSMENSPFCAALGHVAECMMQTSGGPFWRQLYAVCLPGMPVPAANVAFPAARAVEWDIYVDVTPDLRDNDLLLRMAISHGSPFALIKEACGLSSYASIARESPTPLTWLVQYAQTVLLLIDPDACSEDHSHLVFWRSRVAALQPADVGAFLIDVWPHLFSGPGGQHMSLRVVLDIKTRRANPEVIRRIITAVNGAGVVVQAVGSFAFDQLEDVFSRAQTVNGKWVAAPLGLHFFHTAGDVVAAHHTNRLQAGTTYLFNAGSLLQRSGAKMQLKPNLLERLRAAVEASQVLLGVYVQEHLIHPKALAVVIEAINTHSGIFAYGMCLSPVNGLCHATAALTDVGSPIARGERVDTGLGAQKYVGHSDTGGRFWFL